MSFEFTGFNDELLTHLIVAGNGRFPDARPKSKKQGGLANFDINNSFKEGDIGFYLSAYLPADVMSSWVEHFLADSDLWIAVEENLGGVANSIEQKTHSWPTSKTVHELQRLQNHPDVILSLSIFHVMYEAYFEQLSITAQASGDVFDDNDYKAFTTIAEGISAEIKMSPNIAHKQLTHLFAGIGEGRTDTEKVFADVMSLARQSRVAFRSGNIICPARQHIAASGDNFALIHGFVATQLANDKIPFGVMTELEDIKGSLATIAKAEKKGESFNRPNGL